MARLTITLGGRPVQDALAEADNLSRLGFPPPPDFHRANCLLNPLGEHPARGWFLLLRQDLNALDLNALLTLSMQDGYGNSVRVPGLVVAREPTCLTPSRTAADPLACYLVEVADSRYRCHNPYYSVPANKQYNVRAPGWGGQYYAATLNAGQPWTWAGMVADLWGLLTAQLGAAPALPLTPDGVPERYRFLGVSAWRSLCLVLDKLGCAVAWNPSAGKYTIVQVGGADTTTAALLQQAAGRLILDRAYLPVVRGRVPAGVLVHFHRVQDHGSERMTEQDASQFVTSAVYTVQVNGTAAQTNGAEPGVYHPLWDDLPALYDTEGNLLNGPALTTRAQVRATAFYNRLQGAGGGRLDQVYSGILNVSPGATIRGVIWRQDLQRLTTPGEPGGGLVTEVIRTPWTQLRVTDDGQFEEALADGAALRPPDYRVKEPVYPDLCQLVRLASSTPNANGFYDAYVQTWNPTTGKWEDQEEVWVLDANG